MNAYADQLETPDELKLRHESTPSELGNYRRFSCKFTDNFTSADYDEVKLNTPLNSAMRVPVSLPEDSLDKEQVEESVFQKETQSDFQKEIEEEKETDPESVYLSAQEEQENEQTEFLSLGEEQGSSKSDNEEEIEIQKRSSSRDESAEPDLSKIVVSEDEDDFPEPCPDPTPAVDTVKKPETVQNQIEITNTEISQLPESSETNESNNNR